MYLSKVKIWNFRKFGSVDKLVSDDKKLRTPDLIVPFKKGLNVLIGENDSGKTTIIDAIRLVLRTHSFDPNRIDEDDFYADTKRFRIECHFNELEPQEARNFIEWLTILDDEGEVLAKPNLKVMLEVRKNGDRIFNYEVKAGPDDEGKTLNAEAREYLHTTYLRPLRDAETEFVPKRNSRLSQILQGHEAFKGSEKDHHLVKLFEEFNTDLRLFFEGKRQKVTDLSTQEKTPEPFDPTTEVKQLKAQEAKSEIDRHMKAISDFSSLVEVSPAKLKSILEALALCLESKKSGLGTYNKLYIAAELLHLEKKDWDGIRLGLIEEIEAHLHPQAQLRVIEHLQNHSNIQFIFTTHSPNLASKVKLENLILCSNSSTAVPSVFPLEVNSTELSTEDYLFLERFIDVTKSNLFFAKGVILVEGWAEEILIPALAKKAGFDLTKCGVSIVNVGSKALFRYSKIFLRKNNIEMNTPISVVTDIDTREYEEVEGQYSKRDEAVVLSEKIESKRLVEEAYNKQKVLSHIAPHWTLEYSLFKSPSLTNVFQEVVKEIHTHTLWGDDFEKELAKKLINNGLNKTEIAYRLAQKLDEDSLLATPQIIINTEDQEDSISYLINAIKYACSGPIIDPLAEDEDEDVEIV